jgi:hypothetical protein
MSSGSNRYKKFKFNVKSFWQPHVNAAAIFKEKIKFYYYKPF